MKPAIESMEEVYLTLSLAAQALACFRWIPRCPDCPVQPNLE